MYIRKVTVRNFRLLVDGELVLEDQTTLIVGCNNSGKTSLSKVIRRFLVGQTRKFQIKDFSNALYDSFCAAFKAERSDQPDDEVRSLIPCIELRLLFRSDLDQPDLDPLSDFVIDLDPEYDEALVVVRYNLSGGAILDEIQRVPDLLSYLQVLVDKAGRNSLFVLTGSEQFRLSDAISQSLAWRTTLLRLLLFSLAERLWTGASDSVDDILYSRFSPRIYNRKLKPRESLGDYFGTYVKRDVRRIGEIRNLANFRRSVRLYAGCVWQLADLSSLGADAGVSHTTAGHWLTVLEASYVVFRFRPFHANIRKRLVETPKLYFYGVGLVSNLIGIEHSGQLSTHPLRGTLFENAVVVEVLKRRFNRDRRSNLSFFCDIQGLDCNLRYENSNGMGAIEVKSGATIASDWFDSLNRVAKALPQIAARSVVYGGSDRQSRRDGEVVPLVAPGEMLERFEGQEKA